MINAPRPPADIGNSINPPGPFKVAGDVILLRPSFLQECFGFSVATLLAQIGPHGIAAMMPDHRRWTETQGPTVLLQTPADVHVIASYAELGVKSVDGFEA